MRARYVVIFCIALSFLFLAGSLHAAGEKAAPVAVESETAVSRKEKQGRVTTYLKAIITQADVKVTAKTAVGISGNGPLVFTCTGAPLFTDAGSRITAARIELTPSARLAICSGQVTMVTTPAEAEKNGALPATVRITADTLRYDYAAKTVIASGRVTVDKDGQTLAGDACVYDARTGAVTVTVAEPDAPQTAEAKPVA